MSYKKRKSNKRLNQSNNTNSMLQRINETQNHIFHEMSKNKFTKEYNITHIILGIFSISIILAPIIASILIFGYLSNIGARNLFIDFMNQSFTTILIPIIIFIAFPIITLEINILRYLDITKNSSRINEKEKIYLVALNFSESIILPCILTIFIIHIKEINILKLIILCTPILIYFIISFKEMNENIDILQYIFHTTTLYSLFPFSIFAYLSGNDNANDINFILMYFILAIINFFWCLLYTFKEKKANPIDFILNIFIFTLFSIIFTGITNGKMTKSAFKLLGISSDEYKPFIIKEDFIKINSIDEKSLDNLEKKENFYIICAQLLFKTEKFYFLKNKKELQVPNEFIYSYQGQEKNCSSPK